MKSNSQRSNNQKSFLKVIKNAKNLKKGKIARIYINTLIPGFNSKNSLGETISGRSCVLL